MHLKCNLTHDVYHERDLLVCNGDQEMPNYHTYMVFILVFMALLTLKSLRILDILKTRFHRRHVEYELIQQDNV